MKGPARTTAWHLAAVVAATLLAAPRLAQAILFDATGDPGYNTNAPTGGLAGCGWQYEGQFGVYLGTAVAPHYFLTAQHIGGGTNWGFFLDGTNYHPVASFTDSSPGSDLRLWKVADRLPRYAPFCTGTNEVGLPLIAFGRGTQRGAAVVTDGLTNGWYWGAADTVMRWGSNRVEGVVDINGAPYLYATFDPGAGPDECHLSDGDSGGALFVMADGAWQLAGIHYAVDGPFNTTNSGGGSNAAIRDAYGLYIYDVNTNWTRVTDHEPSGFYSSRVSARYAWITNTIADFDSNTNGIPDWWEARYSDSIHGLDASADPDQDGFSNLAEWIAGTDPTNAASVFRIASFATATNSATLTFEGWTDRLYCVETAPAATGHWATAGPDPFAGQGGITAWIDTNLVSCSTSRFYRLKVLLPP